MTTPPWVLLGAVAVYLQAEEDDILFRWIQVASHLPAHVHRSADEFGALRDHMPQVLAQLRQVMLQPVNPTVPASVAYQVAYGHAETRYAQQVPAYTVVKEYQLLRRELWRTVRGWPAAPQLSPTDVFLLEEHINFALDEFVAITLDAFVRLQASRPDTPGPGTAHDRGG